MSSPLHRCRNDVQNMRKSYGNTIIFSLFVLSLFFADALGWLCVIWLWMFALIVFLKKVIVYFPADELLFSKYVFRNFVLKSTCAILCLLPFFLGERIEADIAFLVFFFFGIFFWLTGKISFVFALLLLFTTIYFLLIDQQSFAEISSIYLYYCLIIWVLFEFIDGSCARYLESDFLNSFPRIKRLRGVFVQNERIKIWCYLMLWLILGIGWFIGFFEFRMPLLVLIILELGVMMLALFGLEERRFLLEIGQQLFEGKKILITIVALGWMLIQGYRVFGLVSILVVGLLLVFVLVLSIRCRERLCLMMNGLEDQLSKFLSFVDKGCKKN